jgi:hypothetical protein
MTNLQAGRRFGRSVEAQEWRLWFRYAVGVEGGKEWEEVNEWVPISWTPCNYGGSRPWLHCPQCSRRVAILYPTWQGRLRCRHCANLVYESQRLSFRHRLQRREDKLRRRVISTGDGWWYKPPRMHWSTFNRICDQADELEHYMRADTFLFVQKLNGQVR